MIHTASYNDTANHKGELVSISVTEPKGFRYDRKFHVFVPEWKLVDDYKKGRINWEQYTDGYNETLKARWLQPSAITRFLSCFDETRDMTMLCWCKDVANCHRSLVYEWLRKYAYHMGGMA